MFYEDDKKGCEFVLVTNFEVQLVTDMIKKKICLMVELIYVVATHTCLN